MVVDLQELARRMLADYDARTPGQLFAEPFDLTTNQAYALQAEIARLRERRGEHVIGYKVGCTSKAIQTQLGVGEPIFGRLFDTGCHPSGVQLPSGRFANLAVEGELAVQLGKDLSGPAVSEEKCRGAIESVFPVIELHHYVLPAAWPPAQWLIASSGMHAGFVLAEELGGGPPHRAQRLSIRINDDVVDATEKPWTMQGPAASLRWLAARLGQCGLHLSRGQVILTGSPMKLFQVGPGSRVLVEAPPLGTCCVEITI